MALKTLIASTGMILTNGSAYGLVVNLGINDSPNNWYEITLQEYQEILEKNSNEVPTENFFELN